MVLPASVPNSDWFRVTTSNLPSDHDEAMKLGIEGYIQKTGDEQDLINPIVAYLAHQGD